MPFINPQATATEEQVGAAKAIIKLEKTVEKFVQQSQKTEESNKCLTYFIILLSVVQTIAAVIPLSKIYNKVQQCLDGSAAVSLALTLYHPEASFSCGHRRK